MRRIEMFQTEDGKLFHKQSEAEAQQTEAIKRTQRAELDALIAAKKAEAKQNLSIEELEAMRAKL